MGSGQTVLHSLVSTLNRSTPLVRGQLGLVMEQTRNYFQRKRKKGTEKNSRENSVTRQSNLFILHLKRSTWSVLSDSF